MEDEDLNFDVYNESMHACIKSIKWFTGLNLVQVQLPSRDYLYHW